MKKIAVFGGSFDPPGTHHQRIAAALAEKFDEVLVVPCGPRPDKASTASIDPVHRAAMVDMAFRSLPRVRVELFDLEQASFTPTFDLDARLRDLGELWHAVGSDLLAGGSRGESEIQSRWYRGDELWKSLRFAVFERPGFPLPADDLPPQRLQLALSTEGMSSSIRERVFRHEDVSDLVSPEIGSYIARYRLYRGGIHLRTARLELEEVRPLVIADRHNQRALSLAERLTSVADPDDANCVLVIGGDGTMLRAIRRHWRRRRPVIGISAGHYGFLLNAAEDLFTEQDLFTAGRVSNTFILQHLPLMYVETQSPEGKWTKTLAFNDAWVERASAQTAWIQVSVDGDIRLSKLICDGALICTAAGSTAYARAMGATPLRVDTPELLLVGSNPMQPLHWKSAHLSLESVVEFRALDPKKRPLLGFADGVEQGAAAVMRVRKSRIAAVELGFTVDRDLTAKLTELQFPQ